MCNAPRAGHLSCLAATDLYRYLSQEHDATIIGVLLGMAAAKRCASHGAVSCLSVAACPCVVECACRRSQDAGTSKMLFLHLPTRHPAGYPELEISSLVQVWALWALVARPLARVQRVLCCAECCADGCGTALPG